MNICVFSIVTYWHGLRGGMEIHGKLLSEGLAKRGHEVTIISTRHPEGKEYEEIDGVKIYYLKNTLFGSLRGEWGKESVNKFKELHQIEKFDLVWSQSFAGYYFAKEVKDNFQVPLVTILQGPGQLVGLNSIIKNISNFRDGFLSIIKFLLSSPFFYFYRDLPLVHRSSKIIGVSHEASRALSRLYFLRKGKVHTVLNGVDTDYFMPDEKRRNYIRNKFGIRDGEKLLLTLGTVNKEKGHHLVVKALPEILKNIKDVKLMIVGDGDYSGKIKKMVERFGVSDRVIFPGFIPHHQTADYYNAADLYILPTLRIEGLPFALIEAMACRKPVISSKKGGIPSAVDHQENGILIPTGDVGKLTKNIEFLLTHPQEVSRMARNAREKAIREMNSEIMTQQTIEVLKTAMADGKS